MAIKAPIGTDNLIEIYYLTAGGQFDTLAFSFDKNVTMDYTGNPLKQSLIIDLDNKIDDEDYNTFLAAFLRSAVVEETKVEYSDSSYDTVTSGVSYSVPFGYIWYGGTYNSKNKVISGRGVLSGDTGNASYQAKNIGNYPVQITTISGLQLTIPTAKYNTNKVTGASQVTIPTAEYGTIKFMTAV